MDIDALPDGGAYRSRASCRRGTQPRGGTRARGHAGGGEPGARARSQRRAHELEEARANYGTASRELAEIRTAAANVVDIRDQNTRLQQRLTQRDQEVEQLTADNTNLAGRNSQNWFIVGAGVLLAGIVVGLVAPTLRRKKRSDW